MLKIKRAYERKEAGDGERILIDRLWPRGVSKDEAGLDAWRGRGVALQADKAGDPPLRHRLAPGARNRRGGGLALLLEEREQALQDSVAQVLRVAGQFERAAIAPLGLQRLARPGEHRGPLRPDPRILGEARRRRPHRLHGLVDAPRAHEHDAAVAEHGLEGVIQIAAFHPGWQFEGTAPDDLGNYSNRAPFPILHLLREASVARAVAAFPEAETIYEKNIGTLEKLGRAACEALIRT